MNAHAWVWVLSIALGAAVVGDLLLNHQRSIWKRAFTYRVADEQFRNAGVPDAPSEYELAMDQIRRREIGGV